MRFKSKYLFLLFVIIFLLFVKSIKVNGTTKYLDPIYTVKTSTNLKYGSAVGYNGKTENLLLDIYEPNDGGAENRPLIIFVHGGSFHAGSKSDYGQNAINFAKKGYVVSSINYRLDASKSYTPASPDINKPINISKEDALTALHWLITNADQYKIDTERVIFGGSSAGAVTALYTSYSEEMDAKKIKAVYSIAGAVMPDGLEIIDESDPPTSMFNGTADTIVPYTMATATVDKLKNKGITVNLVSYQGEGHSIIGQENDDIHQKLTEFLYTYVNLPSSSPTLTQTVAPTPTPIICTGQSCLTPTDIPKIKPSPTPVKTPEDLNNDGLVNMTDIEELIKNYLFGDAKADFNQDKVVNGYDYFKLYEKISH